MQKLLSRADRKLNLDGYLRNPSGKLFLEQFRKIPHLISGLHKIERNFSLLSFGVDPKIDFETEAKSDDASQVLSALLPFEVALTSVAALSKPSTFT
ncbi:hypothetical protein CASFOL_010978 [Castilleja foliolosa]|uniref:Uncharacterized protein n=1 Tax=Castilleja foliolosa TaxID=1961234 RepID=A0ABD3DUL6_9LAMI